MTVRAQLQPKSLPYLVVALIALASLALLGLVGWREWVAREVQLRETNTALVNLASSFSQHAEDAVNMTDAVLAGVVERLETDGTSPTALIRLNQLLGTQTAVLPLVREFVIYGEDGNSLASSMPTKGSNDADRLYFQRHRDLPDRGPQISPSFRSRSSGRWTVAVSRRFQNADGSFAGVVMAAIDTSYFVNLYATYDLGERGTVLLLTKAGTLLARYPFDESAMGQDFSNRPVFQALQHRSVGTYDGVAGIDGIKRFAGYRQSDRFPLIVTVGMSEKQALGAWRSNAEISLTVAVALAAIILLLGYLLARQLAHRQAMRVRDSEELYRLIAESTSDAITCLDLGLKRTYSSPAYYKIFGYEPEQVIGKVMTAIMHPDDVLEVYRQVGLMLSGEQDGTHLAYRKRHVLGHWIWTEGSISVLRDPSTGQAASVVCSIRDISERHAQAEELQRVNTVLEQLARHLTSARDQAEQASRAKTRFLAGISHELRTPLNGIMGYAQLLRMEGGLNAAQTARVNAMLGAGTHLLEMINSVLDLSQIEAEQLEVQAAEVDLHVVATACLDLVRPTAEAKQLALRLVAAPDVPRRVMTDPVRLRQILLNLMGNAVKFTVKCRRLPSSGLVLANSGVSCSN